MRIRAQGSKELPFYTAFLPEKYNEHNNGDNKHIFGEFQGTKQGLTLSVSPCFLIMLEAGFSSQ